MGSKQRHQKQDETRRTWHNSNKVGDLAVFHSMKGGKARPAWGRHYMTIQYMEKHRSQSVTCPNKAKQFQSSGFHHMFYVLMMESRTTWSPPLFSQSRSCINQLSWTLRTPKTGERTRKTAEPLLFWYLLISLSDTPNLSKCAQITFNKSVKVDRLREWGPLVHCQCLFGGWCSSPVDGTVSTIAASDHPYSFPERARRKA